MDRGFSLIDNTTGDIIWSHPFDKLKGSGDDSIRLFFLDFGTEDGEIVCTKYHIYLYIITKHQQHFPSPPFLKILSSNCFLSLCNNLYEGIGYGWLPQAGSIYFAQLSFSQTISVHIRSGISPILQRKQKHDHHY